MYACTPPNLGTLVIDDDGSGTYLEGRGTFKVLVKENDGFSATWRSTIWEEGTGDVEFSGDAFFSLKNGTWVGEWKKDDGEKGEWILKPLPETCWRSGSPELTAELTDDQEVERLFDIAAGAETIDCREESDKRFEESGDDTEETKGYDDEDIQSSPPYQIGEHAGPLAMTDCTEELGESSNESSDDTKETDPNAAFAGEHVGYHFGGKGGYHTRICLPMYPNLPSHGSPGEEAEEDSVHCEYSEESASESGSSSSQDEIKEESSKSGKRAKSEPSPKKEKKKPSKSQNKEDYQFENAGEIFTGTFQCRNAYKGVHGDYVPPCDHIEMQGDQGTKIVFERTLPRVTTKVKGANPYARYEHQPTRPKGTSKLAKAKGKAFDAALKVLAEQAGGKAPSKTRDTMAEAAMADDKFHRVFAAELMKVGPASLKAKLKECAREAMKNIQFPTPEEVRVYGQKFFNEKNKASCHMRRLQSEGDSMVNKCMEVDEKCKHKGCALSCLHWSCDVFDAKKGCWASKTPNTATRKPHVEIESEFEKFVLNSEWQSFEIIRDSDGVPTRAEVVRFHFNPCASSKKSNEISQGLVTVLGSDTVRSVPVNRCDLIGKWTLKGKKLVFSRIYRATRSSGSKRTTRWTKKRKGTGAAPSRKRKKTSTVPAKQRRLISKRAPSKKRKRTSAARSAEKRFKRASQNIEFAPHMEQSEKDLVAKEWQNMLRSKKP